jgi:hypothetical protein
MVTRLLALAVIAGLAPVIHAGHVHPNRALGANWQGQN